MDNKPYNMKKFKTIFGAWISDVDAVDAVDFDVHWEKLQMTAELHGIYTVGRGSYSV